MNIEMLLKYQEIDTKYHKLELQVTKNEFAVKKDKLIDRMKKALEIINSMSIKSVEIMQSMEKSIKAISSFKEELTSLNEDVNEYENLKDIDASEKKINQLMKKIEQNEKDILRLQNELVGIKNNTETEMSAFIKCKKDTNTCQEQIEKIKVECIPQAKQCQVQLTELSKEIEQDILIQYRNVRKKTFPVLVEYEKTSQACMGCGIGLSNDIICKFEKDGLVDCPNCGRLMFKIIN